MQHFYGSFALVFQICVRRGALELFGLNDDELLPDLHITRNTWLIRTHRRQTGKKSAEVIQVASESASESFVFAGL